ncbi:aspartate/glutamate racemase family protein [Jiella marina]|uniref:aspartate/glutamate racemase family protein n=1 Tax=Jiella sp. LLJ827 TaxID=2917712 RepID=UPI002101A91F|nr:aspartate/glutamate racemase family protein [Jiella sp. LLJ827]MCQ0986323.1 aspartate/glutamate racemase family protein [Jiella sp. LLJ827]
MHIHIINPNTTAAFTEADRLAGSAVAAPQTRVTASEPKEGVPSIESHFEEAVATLGVVEEVRRHEAEGVDAFVIACFGDTGLSAAREVACVPVVGMTEAALMAAAMVAQSFSIVTLPARTRIHAHRVVASLGLGLAGRCLPIRAVDVPVLYGEEEDEAVRRAIASQGREAIEKEGAEAIVLGCAGIGHLAAPLSQELGVPVIDGVAVAVGMAETLVRNGLATSKRSSFAAPPDKPLSPRYRFLADPADETNGHPQ